MQNKIKKYYCKKYYTKKVNEWYEMDNKPRIAFNNVHRRSPCNCKFEEFKERMEQLFIDGMNWENYGAWEVDHIFPVAKGGKSNIDNLQPLWSSDNKTKGAR